VNRPSKALNCSTREEPLSIFARDNCGFLDLTNGSEFVLDCVVGDQNPHGLAAIIGTEEVFCVDEQQSIFLGSIVKDQLREALSALERKIAPDILVELCDVRQFDLLIEGKPHDHFRCFYFGQLELVSNILK